MFVCDLDCLVIIYDVFIVCGYREGCFKFEIVLEFEFCLLIGEILLDFSLV